ncbi:MAG: insulinase family protein [Saprospiraceae bacterium]|nr:insulinase family protein [Candidatus Brachybacter algidus]
MAGFYKKYYQPDNSVLVVAGQIDVEKTLKMIKNTSNQYQNRTEKKIFVSDLYC